MSGRGGTLFSRVGIIVFIFFFIYYPPLFEINSIHLCAGVAYLYLLRNYKSLNRGFFNNTFKEIVSLYAIAAYYMLMVGLVTGKGYTGTFVALQYLLEILPCMLMLGEYFRKGGYSQEDAMRFVLAAAMLQSVLSALSFSIPSLQRWTIERAISYGFNESKFTSFIDRRYYGFAYNLVTYTPLVQASLFTYSLYKSFAGNRLYLAYTPLLFFSAVVNSRSALVFISLGLLLIVLFSRRVEVIAVSVPAVLVILRLFRNLLGVIERYSYRTYSWMTEGISEVLAIVTFDASSSYINQSMDLGSLMPKGLTLLFGSGSLSIGVNSLEVSSDIGWVNYVWLGGLVLLGLYCLIYGKISVELLRLTNASTAARVLALHAALTLLVFNFKMPIFLVNEYTVFIYILLAIYADCGAQSSLES